MKAPDRQARGRWAESAACRYLRGRGLTLIARNFRSRLGELDLIMQDGGELVFVEVRCRKHSRFGDAAASIGVDKQRRLRAVAEQFLSRHPEKACRSCRFDVLAVTMQDTDYRVDWIRDAF